MAVSKLDMANWTTTHQGMTLAQAFGVTKGTVTPPKLTAVLPGRQAAADNPLAAAGLPPGDANPPSGQTEAANAALGEQMAAAAPYNWTGAQWTALNNIVMAESGWNQTAENPSSGAYGIPQALPGSKMASAGSNWQTDAATQIAWMLQYIVQRYGTPVTAWQFHLAHGWY
jgi:resuscitation-promoting factor RpfB